MSSIYEKEPMQFIPPVNFVRNYYIVKSDVFVKEVPYPRFSLLQNKIFHFLLALANPDDRTFLNVEFDIKNFIKIFDMNENSVKNIKQNIIGLRGNPVFTMTNPELEGSTAITWCHIYIEEKTGLIQLRLDEDLERYFLHIDLEKGYIKYNLSEIMNLSCKYSFWFYDQFKLAGKFGKRTLSVEYIKKQLSLPDNFENKYIKRKVLIPAIEDINKHTNLQVTYTPVCKGRTIIEYRFEIIEKVSGGNIYELDPEIMFKIKPGDERYRQIMLYLNEKAKKDFDVEDKYSRQLIEYWLEEGYDILDFQQVIDRKVKRWKYTQYEENITPEILFGRNFENYTREG